MAEPEDLLGKADALMARHRPPGTSADPYAGIPVLEEVVQSQPGAEELPVLTELVASVSADDEQLPALAQSMSTSLLAALQPQIDALIEERLKDALSPLVEGMFRELRDDLQLIAREILGEAIGAAVEREIDRRKSGI